MRGVVGDRVGARVGRGWASGGGSGALRITQLAKLRIDLSIGRTHS